jgi:hypothetical protein
VDGVRGQRGRGGDRPVGPAVLPQLGHVVAGGLVLAGGGGVVSGRGMVGAVITPASISSAAVNLTCSRWARSSAVSPPPSEYS